MNSNIGIPTEEDWGDWKFDLDLQCAHDIFYGKTNQEVQGDFYRCVIERADELGVMSGNPFKYYMLGFRDFIVADDFIEYDESDAASCFLNLVESKLIKNPDDIKSIIDDLYEVIVYISENQRKYNASESIYGNFKEQFLRIKNLLEQKR